MLHQSTEFALKSLLLTLLRSSQKTHNLHKLFRNVRRISEKVFWIFPRDTEQEVELFQVLYRAYIHARYREDFSAPDSVVEILMERVSRLLDTIRNEFPALLENLSALLPKKRMWGTAEQSEASFAYSK